MLPSVGLLAVNGCRRHLGTRPLVPMFAAKRSIETATPSLPWAANILVDTHVLLLGLLARFNIEPGGGYTRALFGAALSH